MECVVPMYCTLGDPTSLRRESGGLTQKKIPLLACPIDMNFAFYIDVTFAFKESKGRSYFFQKKLLRHPLRQPCEHMSRISGNMLVVGNCPLWLPHVTAKLHASGVVHHAGLCVIYFPFSYGTAGHWVGRGRRGWAMRRVRWGMHLEPVPGQSTLGAETRPILATYPSTS